MPRRKRSLTPVAPDWPSVSRGALLIVEGVSGDITGGSTSLESWVVPDEDGFAIYSRSPEAYAACRATLGGDRPFIVGVAPLWWVDGYHPPDSWVAAENREGMRICRFGDPSTLFFSAEPPTELLASLLDACND